MEIPRMMNPVVTPSESETESCEADEIPAPKVETTVVPPAEISNEKAVKKTKSPPSAEIIKEVREKAFDAAMRRRAAGVSLMSTSGSSTDKPGDSKTPQQVVVEQAGGISMYGSSWDKLSFSTDSETAKADSGVEIKPVIENAPPEEGNPFGNIEGWTGREIDSVRCCEYVLSVSLCGLL